MKNKKFELTKQKIIAIILCLTVVVSFFGYHIFQQYQEQERIRIAEEKAEAKRKKAYEDTKELRKEIDAYIDSWGVSESQMTVCVRDIENDCIVYERNADQWMRAGSMESRDSIRSVRMRFTEICLWIDLICSSMRILRFILQALTALQRHQRICWFRHITGLMACL